MHRSSVRYNALTSLAFYNIAHGNGIVLLLGALELKVTKARFFGRALFDGDRVGTPCLLRDDAHDSSHRVIGPLNIAVRPDSHRHEHKAEYKDCFFFTEEHLPNLLLPL